MFRKMSLRWKMISSIFVIAFISFSFTVIFTEIKVKELAEKEALDKASQIAYRYAGVVESEIEIAMTTARTLAFSFEGIKKNEHTPKREDLNAMLKQVLLNNPNFIGVWTCWEPNALDGMDDSFINKEGHDQTGRFIPYWNKNGEKIALEALVDYEKEGAGDYYLLSKRTGEETILDPYTYPIGGKEVLLTSLVVPIKNQGKFVGVAGIDIALDSFEKIILTIKPFDTGYGFLVANNNTFVSYPDKELIGKPIKDYGVSESLQIAIKEGMAFTETKMASLTGESAWMKFVPINIGNTNTPWSFAIVAPVSSILKEVRKVINMTILISVISLIIFLLVIYFIANKISSSVKATSHNLQDIAEGEGDLTKRIKVNSEDELGQLANWFNVFVDKLQTIIKGIANETIKVDQSVNVFIDISKRLSLEMKEIADKSKTANNSANEMTTNMSSVAVAIEESSTNISMMSSFVEEMTSTISEISKNTQDTFARSNNVVEKSKEISGNLELLRESAKQIEKIVDVIDDISEQTNLLSLNATIEAARAGEAGKGFAVVANEIKDLANQTVQSTIDIKERIKGVQESTDTTIKEVENIVGEIKRVNEMMGAVTNAISEQSVSTQEIASNISQMAQVISEISKNTNQSSMLSVKITEDIGDINSSTKRIEDNSKKADDNVDILAELVIALKNAVTQFKI